MRLTAGRLACLNANSVKAFFLYWVVVRLGWTPKSLDLNRGLAEFTKGASCHDVVPSSGYYLDWGMFKSQEYWYLLVYCRFLY